MGFDMAKKAIDLALHSCPESFELSFFGGEPLLQLPLLQQATSYAYERYLALKPAVPFALVLNTNATLVTDEVVDWLRTIPNKGAFVSLDGPSTIHDRFRLDAAGRGSHARVVEGIQKLRSVGTKVTPVAVMNPQTVANLAQVVKEAIRLDFNRLVFAPNYRADWDDLAIEHCRDGLMAVANVWIDHFRENGRMVIDPLASKLLTHLYGGSPCPERCQLAGRELAVAPSGNIYPCAQIVGEDNSPDFVIGHVSKGLNSQAIHNLQQNKDRVDTFCAGCSLRTRCDSHCGCKHVALTGEMGRITGVLCDIEELMITTADYLGEKLYAEQNQAFNDMFYKQKWQPARGAKLVPLRLSKTSS